jgi:hypothetical protein
LRAGPRHAVQNRACHQHAEERNLALSSGEREAESHVSGDTECAQHGRLPEEEKVIHVYPVNDKRLHELNGTGCWCEPTVEWEHPEALVIHNSLDGRETLEQDHNAESEDGKIAFGKRFPKAK